MDPLELTRWQDDGGPAPEHAPWPDPAAGRPRDGLPAHWPDAAPADLARLGDEAADDLLPPEQPRNLGGAEQ